MACSSVRKLCCLQALLLVPKQEGSIMKKSIIDLIYTEGLDEQAIAELRKNVVKSTVKKGEVLIRKGDPASHMYCVEKGLLRSFVIDEHGKEHKFRSPWC